MALTNKQKMFIVEYTVDFNATQAAIRAGYSEKTAHAIGQENLRKPIIEQAIKDRVSELIMGPDEVALKLGEQARLDIGDYVKYYSVKDGFIRFDLAQCKRDGKSHLIKKLKVTALGDEVEFYDKLQAQQLAGKIHGIFSDRTIVSGDKDEPIEIKISYNSNADDSSRFTKTPQSTTTSNR